MTGRLHSFLSLGTVDGPGVRCVIFLQGCPLRCACCHNPDTRDPALGTETEIDELVSRVLRYRSYFGPEGGVTVSGGEPLMQTMFTAELFRKLKLLGIHTALDTSGCMINADTETLLRYTDLVLLDDKFPDDENYLRYTGQSRAGMERFLDLLQRFSVPTWLRRVIIPGLNDSASSVLQLKAEAEAHSCVQKTELLPFRKLCIEKYRQLGISFPLESVPEADPGLMLRLHELL